MNIDMASALVSHLIKLISKATQKQKGTYRKLK